MLFPLASPAELRELIQHLTAEVEEVSGEQGQSATTWKKIREDNHLLDSTSYALIAKRVWAFLQEILEPSEVDEDGFAVYGDGPLFGAK